MINSKTIKSEVATEVAEEEEAAVEEAEVATMTEDIEEEAEEIIT